MFPLKREKSRIFDFSWQARANALPAPEVDIFDEPVRCVEINAQWAGFVIGAISILSEVDVWAGDSAEVFRALQQIAKLQDSLSSDCMPRIENIRIQNCVLQMLVDDIWLNVGALDLCAVQGIQGERGEVGQVGPVGATGQNGANGTNGTNGTNGQVGQNGTNGTNGSNGLTGAVMLAAYVGQIISFPRGTCPTGALPCDGGTYLKSTYPDLWASGRVIEDTATTFKVPDYRSRGLIGNGIGSGLSERVLGTSGGFENHTLGLTQIPQHNHFRNTREINEPLPTLVAGNVSLALNGPEVGYGYTWNIATPSASNFIGVNPVSITGGVTVSGGLPHNNMQPYSVVHWCIISELPTLPAGATGASGSNGLNGLNGIDGLNGINGLGAVGLSGANGTNGLDADCDGCETDEERENTVEISADAVACNVATGLGTYLTEKYGDTLVFAKAGFERLDTVLDVVGDLVDAFPVIGGVIESVKNFISNLAESNIATLTALNDLVFREKVQCKLYCLLKSETGQLNQQTLNSVINRLADAMLFQAPAFTLFLLASDKTDLMRRAAIYQDQVANCSLCDVCEDEDDIPPFQIVSGVPNTVIEYLGFSRWRVRAALLTPNLAQLEFNATDNVCFKISDFVLYNTTNSFTQSTHRLCNFTNVSGLPPNNAQIRLNKQNKVLRPANWYVEFKAVLP